MLMITKDDLILIRDELQLSSIACKEIINCIKYGGFVPLWAKLRYERYKDVLSRLNSFLGGD